MRFTIKTIGCKVNTYESNKIKAELIKAGLIFIDVTSKSEYKNLDYYIINTCSVTKVADKKSRQMIHQAKTANKNLKVIATGCYVDAHIEDIDSEIDKYFRNIEKMSLIDYVIKDSHVEKNNEEVLITPRVREFIKIQDGCNQYCTYCIIPFLRGNIKSRDDIDIVREAEEKIKNGTKEIVITGIHLSSFGLDRKNMTYESAGAIDEARKSLLNIIFKIAHINGIERIRLGSLEPRIINEDFIKALLIEPIKSRFCANFCLSLQSGCDKILKAMNRHYTKTDFEKACSIIRTYMDDAQITTDIIVGFPGETESDFNESLEFVKKMRFYNPNVFPYSRRPGTKANEYAHQLTKNEKHKRSLKMIEACDIINKEIERVYNYNDHPILVEEEIEENGKKYKVGYTKEYFKRKIEV